MKRSRDSETIMAQDELPLTVAKGRKGRHEAATDKAIAAARRADTIGDVDGALVTTCRALARQLDVAERTEKPYATAAVARELVAAARAVGLAGDDTGPDPLAGWLEGLDDDDE